MKKQKGGFRKIIGVSMACCMLTNLAVPVSFAEETKKEPDGENAVELPDPLDAQLMDLLRRADPETKSAMLVLLQQRKKDE